MNPDPSIDTGDLAQVQAAGIPAQDAHKDREAGVLWQAREGQVVNAHVYLITVLLCWLGVPIFWAIYRYLRTANHQYILTDQRLLERSGIIVKKMETLELYRVKDLAVSSTFMQTLFGRGQVILQTTDASTPTVLINAVPSPELVSQLVRNRVEACRQAKGVRAFDY